MRGVAVAAGVLVALVSACGVESSKRSSGQAERISGIVPLNEPASPEMLEVIRSHGASDLGGSTFTYDIPLGRVGCSYEVAPSGTITNPEGCTEEDLRLVTKTMERDQRERAVYERETALAEGTTPRAIARLGLSNDETAFFLIYRARTGRDCALTVTSSSLDTDPPGDGAEGGLPCSRRSACDSICLTWWTSYEDDLTSAGPLQKHAFALVSGTVTTAASDLRIRLRTGKSVTVPLKGPVLRDYPKRRVLLAELADFGLRYEALDVDGKVIATYAPPTFTLGD